MSDLTNFITEADKRSGYVRFEDGVALGCVYVDAEMVDDKFNPGQKTVQYTIEVEGNNKTFNSKAAGLARLMSKIEPGTAIEIIREGESFKTKWFVNKLKAKA